MERVSQSDVTLLGESHDNRQHHLVQNAILQAVAKTRNTPVVVMEQYDLTQQEQLDAIARSNRDPVERSNAFEALMNDGWDRAGYRPLLDTAVHHGLPIVAANISRQSLREVSREGFDALGIQEVERLGLLAHWTDAQQTVLEREIMHGHCNALPTTAVGGLSKAQRVRDAIMADKILAAVSKRNVHPAVAILGRGHVRADLGVPWYLKNRAPGKSVLVISLEEESDSASPAQSSAAIGVASTGLFDYVINVKREIPAPDYCAAFKTSLPPLGK
ncbi:MAG: ChaN family lipoprotein [Pseudomonadota bacterium]